MPINAPVHLFTPTAPGTVPGSGGGVINFLRADGGWTPAGGSVTYATLAAMRVAPPAAGITLAQLLNRALPYDGGMGVFTWLTNAPVQPIDDDCVVIIPAGSPANAAWVRQFSGPVNALWAGASPLLADNTAAFLNADTAALNQVLFAGTALPTGMGGTVLLPGKSFNAPTYYLTSNIRLNAHWTGPAPNVQGTSDSRPIINMTGGHTFTFNGGIENLELSGLGSDDLEIWGTITNCILAGSQTVPGQTNINGNLVEKCTISAALTLNPANAITRFNNCSISSNYINVNTAGPSIFSGCEFTNYPINTFGANSAWVFIKNCTLSTPTAVPAGGLVNGVKYIDVDGFVSLQAVLGVANPVFQASTAISFRNVIGFAPTQIIASAATDVSPSQTALVAPVSGTIVQNIGPFTKRLVVPVTYNPTAGAAATLAIALGPTAAPPTIDTNSIPATAVAGQIVSYTLSVPPGWYYSFTVVNATLGAGNTIQ